MATIKEIARLAGVSRGTVDRVLNNRGSVNPETAKKIQSIAKTVKYTPNRAGKTLAIAKKRLKFGFILFSSTQGNPFFLDVIRGIEDRQKAFKEFNATVIVREAPIEDPMRQAILIDELIELGIDGLAITPINHPDIVSRLTALIADGFPVVTVNSDLPGCGRLAYVGSHYYQSGETAAGLMNLVCGKSANVGIVIGSPLIVCHMERVSGFTDRIQSVYPGIHIVDTAVNNDDDAESFSVTKRMLEKNPEMNALYLVSAGVQGACRAVEQLGLHSNVKIISYDATPPTCQLIKQGMIAATIAQQPFTQGTKPLDILLNYTGMGVPPDKDCYYTKIEIKILENMHLSC